MALQRAMQKSGCGAVGSLRAKTIDYRFHDAKSLKQGVGRAELADALDDDYATACSAREGARRFPAKLSHQSKLNILWYLGVAQLVVYERKRLIIVFTMQKAQSKESAEQSLPMR